MGIYAGEILHHANHGGIIVSQHIQLQQIIFHGVIFKMGGNCIRCTVICRMLNRAEIFYALIIRNNYQTAWMLTCGPACTDTTSCQTVFLSGTGLNSILLQILQYEAVGGLICQCTNRAGTEHLGLTEHLNRVTMGTCLIFTGEVQVDIGNFTAAVPQECFKGNIETILYIFRAADRTNLVRHIRTATVTAIHNKLIIEALRVGTTIMRWQSVNLCDTGHIGHQRGTDRASGAHQIAVFKASLDQFLGRHINHVILAQNTAQLNIQTIHDQLGRVLSVQAVGLFPNQTVQFFLRILQSGREQFLGQQFKLLYLIGDQAGILNNHLIGFFLTQIAEFLQHFLSGFEINGQRFIGICKLLGGQQNVTVDLILRFLEMHIAGGANGFSQFLAQADDSTVKLLQILFRLHFSLTDHELVVAQRLDLQKIVVIRNALQFIPVLMVLDSLEKFTSLTGRTHNDTLAVLVQQTLGDRCNTLEILQIGGRDHLIQILQTHLIASQQNDMLGETIGLAAQWTQLFHFLVDCLQGMNSTLMEHFPERNQHIAHGGSIITGAVVIERRQIQMFCHDIQFVFTQLRKQILRKNQGIHIGWLEFQTYFFTAGTNETNIKLRIMGCQRTAVYELQKVLQRHFQLRCILQHIVRDTGETDNLRCETAVWIHEGLEALRNLTVLDHNRTDLGDSLPVHFQTGGLNIKANKLIIERLILFSVDYDTIINIIDEVSLNTVKDLDLVPCGMPRVREGLGTAMVRDSNRRMAPADGLLDDFLGIRQRIRVAHLCM